MCGIRFPMSGRHVEEFMGVPVTGTTITLPGITILHFRGDRVIERLSQADMLGLLVQLGSGTGARVNLSRRRVIRRS